jgi:hypothetical protein
VTARTDGSFLALDHDSFVNLRRFSPYLACQVLLNIATILSGRMADLTEQLRSMAEAPRGYERPPVG